MFCFSVMESSFCFANVEFITVPADSFINDLGPLRSVQAIFVWKSWLSITITLDKKRELGDGADQSSASVVWHFLKITQAPMWIIKNFQIENNLYFNFLVVMGNVSQV